MGFGFNLFMLLIVLPGSLILLVLWLVTQKSVFGEILFWGGSLFVGSIIMVSIISFVLRPFFEKKVLDKADYVGSYVIDRNFFKGKQAN